MHRSRYRITITVLAFLTLGSILGSGFLFLSNQSQDLQHLGKARIEERSIRAELELLNHFKPIIAFLNIVRDWGIQGLAPVKDADLAAARLSPILNRIRNVISFELRDADGVHLRLVRSGDQWITTDLSQANPQSQSVTEASEGIGAAREAIQWQRLIDERGPFYRVTGGWEVEGHRWNASINLGNQGFDELASSLAVGDDSEVLWLGRDGRLIRLSGTGTEGGEGIASNQVLDQVRRELGRPYGDSTQWTFSINGDEKRLFLGAVRQLEIEGSQFRFCVIADQGVLLQDLDEVPWMTIYLLLALSGIGLAGLLLIGNRALRKGREETEGEGHRHASEEEILALIRSGEGERLEFKSTMRWNIRTDKPGKEVEFSWLTAVSAFLNSSGGTLLIGVDDDGNPTGIEADKFPNEDRFLLHFNNLIKEHIGLEFTGLIDFDIRSVSGVRILVLDCRKADRPVFLKKGQQEDFFIRVGPGSRKLSASEMLEFLKTR